MTTAMPMQPDVGGEATDRNGQSTFAKRRPMTAFLLLVFGIGWPALAIPAAARLPFAPFLLALVYLALLLPALLVSRWADGPGAIRRLLSRTVLWRFSILRWCVILFGMPVLTLVVAAASGTLETPGSGWAGMTATYLFATLITGALILNLWEETAWAGFAQTRLMARRGLLAAALLTALPFAAIHIPLHFEGRWTWAQVWVGLGTLFVLAPFYRYLLGMHLLDTRGSILAAGIQHAAWNEAQKLDAVSGEWQVIVAVLVLTGLVAIGRRVWRPSSRPLGTEAEMAAASGWIEQPSRTALVSRAPRSTETTT